MAIRLSAGGYAILAKLSSLAVNFITILLVVRTLSNVELGYYYAFASLIALQVFFELGFNSILVQFSAHEYVHLHWTNSGSLSGSVDALGRMHSLIRLVFRWSALMAAAFVAIISFWGFYFFDGKSELPRSNWVLPWFALVFGFGFSIFLTACTSIMEGAGHVSAIARVRLAQVIFGGIAAWLVLLLGGGLWVGAIAVFVSILINAAWLLKNGWRVLNDAYEGVGERGHTISWKYDVFPLQWRVGLSWLSGYFTYQAFTPIVFKFYGAAEAGRVGFTLAVFNALGGVAASWYATKVPLFSVLIAKGSYLEAKSNYVKFSGVAMLLTFLIIGVFLLFINVLPQFGIDLSNKLVNNKSIVALSIAILANTHISCQASFARSFKKEPYLAYSIVTGILVVLVLIFTLPFGVDFLFLGYAGIMGFVALPLSFYTLDKFLRGWLHG